MKKLLLILLCLPLLFTSCNQERVLFKELTEMNGLMYHIGAPFNGIAVEIFEHERGAYTEVERYFDKGKLNCIKDFLTMPNGSLSSECKFKKKLTTERCFEDKQLISYSEWGMKNCDEWYLAAELDGKKIISYNPDGTIKTTETID